jgi:hypothetical protein
MSGTWYPGPHHWERTSHRPSPTPPPCSFPRLRTPATHQTQPSVLTGQETGRQGPALEGPSLQRGQVSRQEAPYIRSNSRDRY